MLESEKMSYLSAKAELVRGGKGNAARLQHLERWHERQMQLLEHGIELPE